jgi:hypothetical protein
MKYIKEGGVAISCDMNEDLINVSKSIKEQLGEDYEVKIPEKKCPQIKIVNVDIKMLANEDDFLEKIILQNGITTEDSQRELTLVKHYKGKQEKESVILEVDPITYSLMQKREKLCIGWKSYRFFDHLNVVQCFKCYKFGHTATKCRSDKNVCPKCAGAHKAQECQSSEIICSNCKYAAEVLKVPNIDYKHVVYDRGCEAYKRIYKELEQKVNYPNIYLKQK